MFTCPNCKKESDSSVCFHCTLMSVDFASLMQSVVASSESAETPPLASYVVSPPTCGVGRGLENDIVIDDMSISREHAQILKDGDDYYLEDLQSRNGTLLNGHVILDATPLVNGDLISFGFVKLQFLIDKTNGQTNAKLVATQDKTAGSGLELNDYVRAYEKFKEDGVDGPLAVDSNVFIPSEPARIVPDWCQKICDQELAEFNNQLSILHDRADQIADEIAEMEGRALLLETLRNSLLLSDGLELKNSCANVFEFLGWEVETSATEMQELLLTWDGKTEAVVRVAWTESEAGREDFGKLLVSRTNCWIGSGQDVKGILVLGMLSDKPPSDRADWGFSEELILRAKKFDVCLVSTWQLLGIYRDLESDTQTAETLRNGLMAARGRLALQDLRSASVLPCD